MRIIVCCLWRKGNKKRWYHRTDTAETSPIAQPLREFGYRALRAATIFC